MSLLDTLGDACRSLRSAGLRSLLAALTVAIGVAALVALAAVGAGAEAEIARQIDSLGANVLMVLPEESRTGGAGRPARLSADDARAIARLREIAAAAPALNGEAVLVHGNRNRRTRINGTTADYFRIRDWPLAAGRGFAVREERRAAKVALIGATTARHLFGAADPVGREIRVASVPFGIVGVLAPKGQSASGRDQDDILFVPYATMRLRLGIGGAQVVPEPVAYILAEAAPEQPLDAARPRVETLLLGRHRAMSGVPAGFRLADPAAAAVAAGEGTRRTTAWLMAAAAAIVMVSGGIGVVTVMLTAVAERTREIGLRLALGARPAAIGRLFLAEALLICLVGGTLGSGLGAVASVLLGRVTGWPVLVTPQALAAALAFAALLGLTFGVAPARAAARLSPANALHAPH